MIGYAIFEGEVYSTVNYIGLSLLGLGFLISIVDIFKYED
jgi:hypothetical protein